MCELKTELFINNIKMTFFICKIYTRILNFMNMIIYFFNLILLFYTISFIIPFSKFKAESNGESLKCVSNDFNF